MHAGTEPPPPPSTRFQGSKYKLLDWLWEKLSALSFETVLDAFGGSGCVSHFLKGKGKSVTFNDVMRWNCLCAQAIVANDDEELTPADIALVVERNPSFEYDGVIERTFHDIYFTDNENRWLDTTVQNISRLPTNNKQALAYYGVFQAAISKRPYNLFHRKNLYMRLAQVERSFGNKATWDKPFPDHFRAFVAEVNRAVFSTGKTCQVLNMDASAVLGRYDLVYIDPPYVNRRGIGVDYYGFYHFLEGMANYTAWPGMIDYPSKHRRLKPVKSAWLNAKQVHGAFHRLFERFAESILVVSYRSDGIPSLDELARMLRQYKRNVVLETLNGSYKYVLSTNGRSTEAILIGTD
jgi:adenine-specific DNA methylase